MCRICDGATRDQLNEEAATEIAVNGYMLQGVGDSEHSPWVYSVGLLDSSFHPELIVPGVSPEVSAPILRKLADAIFAGQGFKPGASAVIDGTRLRFGEVHDVQYDLDTFAMWHELWHVDVIDAIELSALQVIFDHTDLCAACRARQIDLSDPDARVGGPLPRLNRAARRRRKRC
jgi:hypothetical protein